MQRGSLVVVRAFQSQLVRWHLLDCCRTSFVARPSLFRWKSFARSSNLPRILKKQLRRAAFQTFLQISSTLLHQLAQNRSTWISETTTPPPSMEVTKAREHLSVHSVRSHFSATTLCGRQSDFRNFGAANVTSRSAAWRLAEALYRFSRGSRRCKNATHISPEHFLVFN